MNEGNLVSDVCSGQYLPDSHPLKLACMANAALVVEGRSESSLNTSFLVKIKIAEIFDDLFAESVAVSTTSVPTAMR
jgi:hypothetical protein